MISLMMASIQVFHTQFKVKCLKYNVLGIFTETYLEMLPQSQFDLVRLDLGET